VRLYYYETMNPRKACATAKYLALPVDYVRVDLGKGEHKTPDYLARNPNGTVPTLEDGADTLWESMAIMVRLCERAESQLWPTHAPGLAADVVRWLSWDAFHFAPHASTFYFEHLVKPKFGLGAPDQARLERATPALHNAARLLDAHLGEHAYLVGDSLTIADFCLAVLLPYSEQIELPLADYRNIQRWQGRLMELEAFRDPWPAGARAPAANQTGERS
jgi:glutathione S-transferase